MVCHPCEVVGYRGIETEQHEHTPTGLFISLIEKEREKQMILVILIFAKLCRRQSKILQLKMNRRVKKYPVADDIETE